MKLLKSRWSIYSSELKFYRYREHFRKSRMKILLIFITILQIIDGICDSLNSLLLTKKTHKCHHDLVHRCELIQQGTSTWYDNKGRGWTQRDVPCYKTHTLLFCSRKKKNLCLEWFKLEGQKNQMRKAFI